MPWEFQVMLAWSIISSIIFVGQVGSHGEIRYLGWYGILALIVSPVMMILFLLGADGLEGWKHWTYFTLQVGGYLGVVYYMAQARVVKFSGTEVFFTFVLLVGCWWLILTG